MPVCWQREVCSCSLLYPLNLLIALRLFPRCPQRLELIRRKAFGPHLSQDPTRNGTPQMMVYLEIAQLRLVAARALANEPPSSVSSLSASRLSRLDSCDTLDR